MICIQGTQETLCIVHKWSWDTAFCVWDEPFKDHSLETAKMVPQVTVLAIQVRNGDQIDTIHLRSLAWSGTCLEHRALVSNSGGSLRIDGCQPTYG